MKVTLKFSQINIKDIPKVGGKNASLGEMYQKLKKLGVNVPNGFATTSEAYQSFIKPIESEIKKVLKDLNKNSVQDLADRGKKIRKLILSTPLPQKFIDAIDNAYQDLEKKYGQTCDVAVRSSATAEDLPDASFAGQQESFLNIRGTKKLLEACHQCIASLFTDRAISYREDKGFGHFKIALSIGVQKMVRSDKASSGVMFSIDTESGFEDVVLINSSWGLGENIVKGSITPDEFYVFKHTWAIINKKLGGKELRMVYGSAKNKPVKNIKTTQAEREQFSISDEEILKLAKMAEIIAKHYKRPMDIEWAKDGITGELLIVQARPETVQSQKDKTYLENYRIKTRGKVVVTGAPIGSKIVSGIARVISSPRQINKIKPGDILVTEMTSPDWEPIMKIASGIITNKGGRTCHAAIVSRELGIPCIVGTEEGDKKIRDGQKITLSCGEGETGYVYDGEQKFEIIKTNLKNIPKTKTKIMMNLGNADQAFEHSFIPNDGVGLAREEFIITSSVKIHPLALINYKKLNKKSVQQQIDKLTIGYKDKSEFYVDKLSYGIAMIASAFYPKDVIVRLSDFKSNEYADLIGGKEFEPKEDNPMIGWRGASRYYDPKYQPAFVLECQALKKVREEMGLKNIKIMVPFCRTVEEGKKVLQLLKENGLEQGKDGLEVYVMVEIPANVILADQFAEIFDGFSIGSNDLTQLALGLDRDSELIAHIGDERNEAVKRLVEQAIKVARKKKIKIGICGEAPSDFPDFAKFLVEQRIDSMSLTPEVVVKTTLDVAKIEAKLKS